MSWRQLFSSNGNLPLHGGSVVPEQFQTVLKFCVCAEKWRAGDVYVNMHMGYFC